MITMMNSFKNPIIPNKSSYLYKIITFVFIITLFLSSDVTHVLGAGGYSFPNVDVDYNVDIPRQNMLTHSSGKAVTAWIGTTGKTVEIRVLLSTGDLAASYYHSVMDSGIAHKIYSILIVELDDNEVLIFSVAGSGNNPEYTRGCVSRLNMNTYTHTEYTHNNIIPVQGGTLFQGRLSNSIKIGNYVYCLFIHVTTAPVESASVLRFDSGTNTLSDIYSSSDVIEPLTTTNIQNPTIIKSSETSFICAVATDAQEIIKTYIFDISGATLTFLGNTPTNYKMNYNRYHTVINGVVNSTTVDDDIYYYFSFVYSTGENLGAYTPAFQVYYMRQIFNNTITSGNLIGNSITGLSVSPRTYQSAAGSPWTVGVMKQNSLTEFYVWYPYYEDYDEGYIFSNYKLTIELGNNTLSAFYDIDTVLSIEDDEIDSLSSIQDNFYAKVIYKEPFSQFQYVYDITTEIITVYYGYAGLTKYYTVTRSYTPTDSPLIINTYYTFTYTFKTSGIAYAGGIVNLYVNDALITTKITDSDGKAVYDVQFSSVGLKTIEISFYEDMMEPTPNLQDSVTLLVAEPTTPTTIQQEISLMGTNLMVAAINILPVTVATLFPAFYGGKHGGMIGFCAGLIIGVAISISAGLLPFYYVYLLALVIIMGLIFTIRSGGGSKE